MNQLQLMSVCARNDFLVIQASQTRRAAERQLDKQPDRQMRAQTRGGEEKRASQAGRKIDTQTDRLMAHTYIHSARQSDRNEAERRRAQPRRSRQTRWGCRAGKGDTGQGTVCQACHAFIHSSFVFLLWRNVFLVLCCVLLSFRFFICERVLKCVARKSKESWWVVHECYLLPTSLLLLLLLL